MEKKIREAKVGVIISTNYGVNYAKSMNVTNEKIARMDKQLVEFLISDVDRYGRKRLGNQEFSRLRSRTNSKEKKKKN